MTIDEINGFQNETKKLNILELITEFNVEILDVNDNIRNLANLYIEKGAIPKYELEDALHIAVASYNKIENLVSWNFKHIVSVNPIRKIHEINKTIGYQEILIGSPELFGGYKYGNI